MKKYRISKYDPQFRNDNGFYEKEEWTSYSDIGKIYEGRVMQTEDYLNIEKQYCNVIISILEQCHVDSLIICDLELYSAWNDIRKQFQKKGLRPENIQKEIVKTIRDGKRIAAKSLEEYFKLILRECFWCAFIDENKTVRVEFGYDYYAYVFCSTIREEYIIECKRKGIFIEQLPTTENYS